MNGNTSVNSMSFWPVQPVPCPTCHRCPTCGHYNPWTAPMYPTITWGTSGYCKVPPEPPAASEAPK